MPSPQLELKSDIASLFKDLEDIASTTQVNAPHVPTIENADITELFSGLNEAHKEAQIEVELKLSLNEKEKLEAFSTLIETFDEIIQPETTPEVIQEKIVEPINEGAKLEALEQLFSELIEPEPIVEIVEEPKNIIVDEVETESLVEEPTNVEKKADLVDKAIVHLNDMQEKTTVKEEVAQITTLRKEFDNFRSLIGQQIASSQMSGSGGGEVRLEFMDDVDRNTAKVDGKFLKYQASTNKFVGADAAGDTITDEQLQDVVGGMISSNTESGITVTYDDTNGKLDFTVGTLNQDTTGNADTATTLETARTIGGVSFDGSANINLSGVNTTGNQDTTGNSATATALENSRTIAGQSFDGTANIDIASTNLSDSSDLARLAAPAFTGNTTGVNLTLSGDLTVNGTTTTISSTNTLISDNLLELNNGAGSNANDSGLVIERGSTGDNAFIGWDESSDKFIVGTTTATGASTGNLSITTGTLTANIEGNITGDVTGNADTATTLETARTIGGVSFDGSSNINLAGVNTTGNQDTSGNAGTATALETARTIGGVSFDGSANINLAGVNTSGNQDTSGNAATATALETARTIHGVSFDGSANIDLSEVVQDTVGAMFSSNTETGITVTYQDADGTIDLVIGTLNQNTTGNAATATALETARTIAGQSFNGTANIAIASTDLSNTSAITLLTSSQTLTNKTLTSPVINTGISGTAFLDEDDLSSDSATKVASQQSIKAYVDAAELRTRAFAIAIGAGL